jgi:multimeric flavodoxin WrbA
LPRMKRVIGIVGSPRVGGNTEFLVREALKAAEAEGVETELITLAGKRIEPCTGCRVCRDKGKDCPIDDDLKPIFDRMLASDGIILGSPVYVGSATAQVKALIDRVTYWAGGRGRPLENKVGGPIVVARRAGQNFTFAQLLYFFFLNGMIIPGTTYWTVAVGREKGEVARDEEGVATVRNFGRKVAWLAKKID